MQQTITFSHFVDAFRDCGRYDQFGYSALRVLFDYFQEYEDDTGVQVELDVIGICCEFVVSPWEEIAEDCRIDLDDCEDDDEKEQAVLAYLNDNTMVCGACVDGIVYAQF